MDKRDTSIEPPEEQEARKFGLAYIKLDGNIGCLVNGAGLAMATMDIIMHKGGAPANFLDIGGGASAEKVAAALRIILADPQVETVLINIFGGITRCDEVANGIRQTLDEIATTIPFVIRLVGTNEKEGREILSNANLQTAESLEEAALKAVKAATGGHG
jgi:succinyl-CoA synthetase beta subunit